MNIQEVDIAQLQLDPKNDRFAELYSGSDQEEDLIEYLLYTEAAEEVAKNIVLRGQFYPDEPLWVLPTPEGYLVKDGNRRCAAVKALQNPHKYDLSTPKMALKTLPVLIYEDVTELDKRIQEQHTHSLFREWDRIAKALKAYEMNGTGSSEDELREIDTNPAMLLKTANFYYEAVKIGGEEFKRLLRRGRSKGVGKTIIFERLFTYAKQCGYAFEGKPNYKIIINNRSLFEKYVRAIIAYLRDHSPTAKEMDQKKVGFLTELKVYGFTPLPAVKPSPTKPPAATLQTATAADATVPSVTTDDAAPAQGDRQSGDDPLGYPSDSTAQATADVPVTLKLSSTSGRRFKVSTSNEALQIIKVIAGRFYAIDAKLQHSARHGRPPLIINDEHDAQYVLEALLQLFFDNIKPEEWTPSYLGRSKRVDFFLPEFKLVIELKMASAKLQDKQLSQQLVEDLFHYSQMPDCKTLVCFIYNPNKSLKQPSVLKADLEKKTMVNIDTVVALIEPQ